MRNLPRPGIEPVSLALAGRFLTYWTTREVLSLSNDRKMFISFINHVGEPENHSLIAVHRLLIVMASLVVEHRI